MFPALSGIWNLESGKLLCRSHSWLLYAEGVGSAYVRVTVWLNLFLSLVIVMLAWSFSKLLNVAWADCCLITDGRLFQRRMVLGKKE